MQTILKVVCDGRSQASMVDEYLAQFCAKAASELQSIDLSSSDAEGFVFAKDDADEVRNHRPEKIRARLGSFERSPNQANSNTQYIFVNPIILSYRPDGQTMRHWVASPSPGPAGNTENE
jgi:hypothetical protein